MTTPDTTAPDAPAPAPALPTDTTPSWEIELLISGALTFASYQLPALLDGWFTAWMPRLPESLSQTAIMTYVFAKGVSFVLAITFTLHLLLRGFWAAVLGLHSVYPDGIRWDNIKSGPIFKAVSQATTPTLPVFISRLDNTASVVFALGALLLQVTLIAGVFELFTVGLAAAVRATTGVDLPITWLFGAIGALFFIPLLIATVIDKHSGSILAPESGAARAVSLVARLTSVVGMSKVMGPMMLVFTSRIGQTRGVVGILVAIYAIFGLVLAQVLFTLGVWSADGYRYLSRDGAAVVLPSHYQAQREGNDRFATTPFIPDEVVDGGLLRLFVPYRIDAFDTAAERSCQPAAAQAAVADTARARVGRDSVVACLGRQLDVQLNGQPVAPPTWHAATDATSGLRGLLTYLPIATLSDGPHTLSVVRLPRRRWIEAAGGKPLPTERYTIPFWIDRTGR